MTLIKRRKRQKFVYCIFACKNFMLSLLCRHLRHSVMARSFCMREYNKRIFAVFYAFNWCHRLVQRDISEIELQPILSQISLPRQYGSSFSEEPTGMEIRGYHFGKLSNSLRRHRRRKIATRRLFSRIILQSVVNASSRRRQDIMSPIGHSLK